MPGALDSQRACGKVLAGAAVLRSRPGFGRCGKVLQVKSRSKNEAGRVKGRDPKNRELRVTLVATPGPNHEALAIKWLQRLTERAQAEKCESKPKENAEGLHAMYENRDMPGGHRYTDEVRERIVQLRAEGLTFAVIALRTGIHRKTIAEISRGAAGAPAPGSRASSRTLDREGASGGATAVDTAGQSDTEQNVTH